MEKWTCQYMEMRCVWAREARALRFVPRRAARALRSPRTVPVTTAVFVLVLCGFLLHLPDSHHDNYNLADDHRGVTLLVWTHPFGKYRKLPDCWARYRIEGCTLTDDPLEYSNADAVLIHHREVATGAAQLPLEPRPRAQKWIWMNYESPTHTPALWRLEGEFNLTLTYRRDSDIFLPYGYLEPGLTRSPEAHLLRTASRAHLDRPQLVAWVISNWSDSQARVAFFYELQRYVRIDVYGRVGVPLAAGQESVVRLLSRYQFYLALENSQHTDYITEKLWNAVLAGAVPVVLGASRRNYERFLPPKAFIHVNDFPSVRGLARYLLMLRRNPTKLWHHLDWREGYSIVQPLFWAHHYCTACREVRKRIGSKQVVQSLEQWFWSEPSSPHSHSRDGQGL